MRAASLVFRMDPMNITRLTRSQYVWRIGVLRFGLAIGLVDAVFEYVRTYGWTGHGFSPPSGLVIVAARFVFSMLFSGIVFGLAAWSWLDKTGAVARRTEPR